MSTKKSLTTHVLDITLGKPAIQVPLHLEFREREDGNGGLWKEIGKTVTNGDGRAEDLLPSGTVLNQGVYRLTFSTAEYFQRQKIKCFYPSISITFEITDTNQHYHVPLLLSPFGYSTYRGS